MESATTSRTAITIEVEVNAPVEQVWTCWTEPDHITQWYFASDEWHAPYAENDLRIGGTFKTTMAAKDGSRGFDFYGVYTDVQEYERIAYTLGDDRKVSIQFISNGNETKVIETFEAEETHPIEFQKAGWQAILNNFKKHTESSLKS